MATTPAALVTAGTAGLGAATAKVLSQNGWRVVVNYSNNAERARDLVEELRALSPLPPPPTGGAADDEDEDGSDTTSSSVAVAIRADLASREDIEKLVDQSMAAMGRLDFVFSNGGWTKFRGLASIDDNAVEEDWDRAFNMNVKSHLWLMQAARPHLDAAEGCFVTTASLAGVSVSGSSLAYGVTKAAQIHLVKALAVMAAPNIRVNSVSPGLLLTDWGSRFSDAQKEAHRQKTKLKRIVTVEDVAEQVFTLVKSKSMTGQNVLIDAGFTL